MKGLNILVLLGLIVNISNAQIEKVWETDAVFKLPESVAFDKKRDVLYVSNYSKNAKDGVTYGNDYISKVSKSGDMIKYDWIGNLTSPTGLLVANDMLYIVERFGIVEYDLQAENITNKYLIQNTKFLNDITIGIDSTLFVTDSKSNVIYRIKNKKVDKWLESDSINHPNGILFDKERIIVGVNGDNYLKSIDIKTKEIIEIALLGDGVIDGIKKIGNDYLVSHFFGNLYLIKQSGEIIELLNTREEKIVCADFEFIEEESLIIIPALWNNKLYGYKYVTE